MKTFREFIVESNIGEHAKELSDHLKANKIAHKVITHNNGEKTVSIDRDPKTMDTNEVKIHNKIRKMGYMNEYNDQPKPSNTYPHKSDESKSVTYSYKGNKEHELSTDNYRFKG